MLKIGLIFYRDFFVGNNKLYKQKWFKTLFSHKMLMHDNTGKK